MKVPWSKYRGNEIEPSQTKSGREKNFLSCGENMIEKIIPHAESAPRTRSGEAVINIPRNKIAFGWRGKENEKRERI